MALGDRMYRRFLIAAAELDDARISGELTADEYADEHERLTASYEARVDTVAEQIKDGWQRGGMKSR